MGYLFLLLTILSESAAIILMKLSEGFQHRLQAALAVFAYLLSFLFLTLALKHFPVGWTNAIWAGGSTVLVVILGIFIFREQLSLVQYVFLALIVIGVVGLQVTRPV